MFGKVSTTNLKGVVRIHPDGTIVEYNSISEAAKQFGNNKRGQIHDVLNGKRKSYKGFIFKYKKET